MRRVASRLGRQDGVTLVELLMYLVIGGVVLSGMTAIAVGTYGASQRVDVSVSDGLEAQTAVSVMTRDLRAAAPVRPSHLPAFWVAEPFEAQFTANIDTIERPVLITLRLEPDGRVLETYAEPLDNDLSDCLTDEEDPIECWDSGNERVRYITSFVVNDRADPAGDAVLRYFDRDGNELGPAENGLSVEDRRTVAQIELSLLVSGDPNQRISRYAVQSRVRLPNTSGTAQAGGE